MRDIWKAALMKTVWTGFWHTRHQPIVSLRSNIKSIISQPCSASPPPEVWRRHGTVQPPKTFTFSTVHINYFLIITQKSCHLSRGEILSKRNMCLGGWLLASLPPLLCRLHQEINREWMREWSGTGGCRCFLSHNISSVTKTRPPHTWEVCESKFGGQCIKVWRAANGRVIGWIQMSSLCTCGLSHHRLQLYILCTFMIGSLSPLGKRKNITSALQLVGGYQIRKVWWRLHPRPDPLEVCRGLDSRQHSRTAWSAKSASLEEWWSLDIWIQPWHPLVACWVPCERSLTTLSSSCSPVGTRCLLLPTQQKPKESWRSRPSFSKIATSSPALL